MLQVVFIQYLERRFLRGKTSLYAFVGESKTKYKTGSLAKIFEMSLSPLNLAATERTFFSNFSRVSFVVHGTIDTGPS